MCWGEIVRKGRYYRAYWYRDEEEKMPFLMLSFKTKKAAIAYLKMHGCRLEDIRGIERSRSK